jgi:hypothetical protein
MPSGFGRCKRRGWGKAFGERGFGRPPTNCICPKCGLIMPHQPGIPCFQTRCPRCSSPMVRQFFSEHK